VIMLNTVSLIVGLVILILMIGIILYFYLAAKHSELMDEWSVLRDKLRLRLDKLPLLLEVFRRAAPEQTALIQDMIALKSKAWPVEKPTPDVVHKHLDLTGKIKQIFELASKVEALKHDVVYLSAKKDLHALDVEIDEFVDPYNLKVRKYNKLLKFPWFLPAVLVSKYKKLPIFEFES